jgi:hypothetical protein
MWEEQGAFFVVDAKNEKEAKKIAEHFVEGYGISEDYSDRENRIKDVTITHRSVEVLASNKLKQ